MVEKLPDDTIISGFEYEYDEIGRISSEKVLAKNEKICYTYDEQSRVTKRTIVSLSGTTETEECFTYDAAGNITADNSFDYVYDTNNRLIEFKGNSVSYDLDGNMLNDGTTTFSYDSGNRLTSAGDHFYTYNAENVRIRNLCSDADTTYVYNTNCKLSQLLCKTTNGITTKYVYGLGLIGEENCGEFKTYHFDYRGSTVALTNYNGEITDTFAYDTYGRLSARTGTSDTIFLYNGQDGIVTDKNELIYMRARYYSSELRRFVNADIVAGEISNAITLNRFAYANGNPVSFIDPFGLTPERGNSNDRQEGSGGTFSNSNESFWLYNNVIEPVLFFFDPDTFSLEGSFEDGIFRGNGSISGGYSEQSWRLDDKFKDPKTHDDWLGGFLKVSVGNANGKIGIGNEDISISLKGVADGLTGNAQAGLHYKDGFGIGAKAKASVLSGRVTVELNIFDWQVEFGASGDLLSAGAEASYGFFKTDNEGYEVKATTNAGTGWFGYGYIFRIKMPG